MSRHVIKHEFGDNEEKLINPESWCGIAITDKWRFLDAQHVALSVGGSVQPCKKCVKAIIRNLELEL